MANCLKITLVNCSLVTWFFLASMAHAQLLTQGTCADGKCVIFKVTETKQRQLLDHEKEAGLISVPNDRNLVLSTGRAVDIVKITCSKSVILPQPIYNSVVRIMKSLSKVEVDSQGLPKEYTPAQQAMLAFYTTIMKQTLEFKCDYPELVKPINLNQPH